MGTGPLVHPGVDRGAGPVVRRLDSAHDAARPGRPAGGGLDAAARRRARVVVALGWPRGHDHRRAAGRLAAQPAAPGRRAGRTAHHAGTRCLARVLLPGQRVEQLPVDGQPRHGRDGRGSCHGGRCRQLGRPGFGAACGCERGRAAPGPADRRARRARVRAGKRPVRLAHPRRAPGAVMDRPASPNDQRGAALLTAMIIVTLVATLAASMVWQQWRAVQVESAERARTQSAWILAGALDWARLILREDARNGGADHLGEPWAVPLAEARLSTFLASDKDNTDDAPDAFLSGAITDAQGRYNLTNLIGANKVEPSELA